MSVKLSYPTEASPTTEVVLGDIEQLPRSRPERAFQTAFETDGGELIIYDWGSTVEVFTVALFPLTAAEVTSLKSFLKSTVNYRQLSWEYTDTLANTSTVTLAQDVVEAPTTNGIHYRMELTLRVV